jgi:hypothetical protein
VSIELVPVGPEAFQNLTVALGGVRVVMDIAYNERTGLYSLSMFDEVTQSALVEGAPIVLGEDMLAPYNFGLGRLIPVDQATTMIDAGFGDLGGRVVLVWASDDEVFA